MEEDDDYIGETTCPHCGNTHAGLYRSEFYPYQAQPYTGTFIKCSCGYIKES